jgi:iron complex transport system ATP-binding protein
MSERAPVRLAGVTSGYRRRPVLDGLELELRRSTITAIVGPNGSGKSTVIRAMARLLPVRRGVVLLDGRDIRELGNRDIARRVSVLPQAPSSPAGITVRELVEMGRFPHSGLFGRPGVSGHRAVDEALESTGLADLAARPLDELSGGERQRAWIALALAQGAETLLLDEPTTFLDVRHQFEVLDLVLALRRDRGMTIALVLHDLVHAANYADRVIVMERGQVVADGAPSAVLTVDLFARVFGVAARVFIDPESGRSLCLPVGTSTA